MKLHKSSSIDYRFDLKAAKSMSLNDLSYDSLLVNETGSRCSLTLNRPERRNALTHQMMQEIGDVVARVEKAEHLRVLVLRGSGGAFSAGGDFDAMANMPPPPAPGEEDPLYEPYRYFGYVLERLNRLPQAVVALVEGAAAGGGFGMAVCADVTIVHKDCKFAIPEPKAGFIPSQVIPFIVRRIGEAQARRLAVTGEAVRGEEALRLGIAHMVCQDAAEMEAALAAVLEKIQALEPAALAAVKGLVLASATSSDAEIMDQAAESLVKLLRRPSALEGIDAFLAKRKPTWAE